MDNNEYISAVGSLTLFQLFINTINARSKEELKMKVSEIFKTTQDCLRLRDIILQGKHELTNTELQEICDLLWDYRNELMNKDVK